MKTILITGGKGFIGSHLLIELCAQHPKAQIISCDSETYAARPPLWIRKPSNLIEEKIDIRDQLAVHRLLNKYQPTLIVHAAAESHVCRSITGPKDFMTTNIMGTWNLLEEYRMLKGKRRFVHISTDEVFGHLKEGRFNERSPMNPRSPYASSKSSADMVAQSYFSTYHMDIVTVNMSNNFGPNQHPEKLIPHAIINILMDKPVVVHGKGDHVRDWLFVGNAVLGIMKAIERGRPGERYCLGGGTEMKNIDVVKDVYKCIQMLQPADGFKLKLKHTNDRPTDDVRYALNTEKAQKDLNWVPGSKDFLANLLHTVEWYSHAMLFGGGGALHGRGR